MIFQDSIGSFDWALSRQLEAVVAVVDETHEDQLAYHLLLHIDGHCIRLTIDEGVLFLEPTGALAHEQHENSDDVMRRIHVPPGPVRGFSVRNGQARIVVGDNATLLVGEDPETTLLTTETLIHQKG